MMKSLMIALGAACALAGSMPAAAASYNFDVLYYGNNNATLAAGSDDPLAQTLYAGDDFTYSLTGQNGVFSTTSGGDIFPFVALALNEGGERVSDFSLTLLDHGVSVFDFADSAADNQFVHLGANTVSLPGGLTFDEILLHDTIVSATTDDGTGGSTPNSILPIFGSPDENAFSPGVVFYSGDAAVPEPASWTMMILGFGLVGAAMRRLRSDERITARLRKAARA